VRRELPHGLGFGHNNGGTGFTADADGKVISLLAGQFVADDHSPQWGRAPVQGCDAGVGEMVCKNCA
jgi:hypothetical protein